MAEQVYRILFDSTVKNKQGDPSMTELGKQVIPSSQIPVATLYRRGIDSFESEVDDPKIAELHYNHHVRRRTKNLLKINNLIKAR